jgi:hypothetical protein
MPTKKIPEFQLTMATPIMNVETVQVPADSIGPHEPFTPKASLEQNGDSEQDEEKGGKPSPLDVVGFDGPGDAYDPVYWSKSKKWGVLLVVALMTLITYVHTLKISGIC